MSDELTLIPKNEVIVSQPLPIMDRLLMAAQGGMAIDMIERFMSLAERNEAREAEKSYNAAYAEYKKNIPTVKPDEKGKIKTKSGFVIEWDYVSLGKLSAEIAKAMAPFGLSFDWDTEQAGQTITVSCFVRHGLGHFRKVSLSCGPDTSGDKSAIHAIKSTITYLKKATLEMASGVSMSEHDDDGVASGAGYPDKKDRPAKTSPKKEEKKQQAERRPGDGGEVAPDRKAVEQWLAWIDNHVKVNRVDASAILEKGWNENLGPNLKSFPADQQNELQIAYKDTMRLLTEREGAKANG